MAGLSASTRAAGWLALTAIFFTPPAVSAQEGSLATFGTTVVVPGGLTGKIYALHSGASKLPNFKKMEPIGTIYAKGFNIPPTDFTYGFPGITDRIEWFAIDFSGRFYVRNPGAYRFRVCSDDGSKLYIDGRLEVNDDGIHWAICKENSLELSGGIHALRLSYFQGPRYQICLMLGVAGPTDKNFRIFNTDEFAPPENPDDWKFGPPDAATLVPAPDAGRRKLDDVVRRGNPEIAISVEVASNGRAVRDLNPTDFVVRDEDAAQEITSLTFGGPVDIVLVIDSSPAVAAIMDRLKADVRRAVSRLGSRDRLGIVMVGERPRVVLPLASSREMILAAIDRLNAGGGGGDVQNAVAVTAAALQTQGRPESTPAIVAITDAHTAEAAERLARDTLWQSRVVLSGLFLGNAGATGSSVRGLVDASGGDALAMSKSDVPLATIFRRLRERYRISYRAPGGTTKTIRAISVQLSPGARAASRGAEVRAPGGYVVREQGK